MSSINSRPIVFETYVNEKSKSNEKTEPMKVLNIDKLNSSGKVATNNTLHRNEKTSVETNKKVENVESTLKLGSVKNISKLFETKLKEKEKSYEKDKEIKKERKFNQMTALTDLPTIFEKLKTFENRHQRHTNELKENTQSDLSGKKGEESNAITLAKEPNSYLQFKIPIPSKGENEIKIGENKPEIILHSASKWLEVKVDITYRDEAKTPVNNEGVIQPKSDKGNSNFTTRSYNGFANDTHREVREEKGNVEPAKENFIAKENSIDVKSLVIAFQKNIKENVDIKSNKNPNLKRMDKDERDKAAELKENRKSIKQDDLILVESLKNKNNVETKQQERKKSVKQDDLILEESLSNRNYAETQKLPEIAKDENMNVIDDKANNADEYKTMRNTDTPKIVENVKESIPTSSIKDMLMQLRNNERKESTKQLSLSAKDKILEKESSHSILKKTSRYGSSEIARPNFKQELENRVSRIQISNNNIRESTDSEETKGIETKTNFEISFQHELKEYDTKGKNKKETQNLITGEKRSPENSNKFAYVIGKKSKEEEITDWTKVEEIVFQTPEESPVQAQTREQSKQRRTSQKARNNKENSDTEDAILVENNIHKKYPENTETDKHLSDMEIETPDLNYYEDIKKESTLQSELTEYIRNRTKKKVDNGNKMPSDDILHSAMLEHDRKLNHGATRIRKTHRPSIFDEFNVKSEVVAIDGHSPAPDYD